MKSQGRLSWPTPQELDASARALYDRIAGGPRAAGPQAFALTDDAGRLNGPFNAMLISPDVGGALQELGSAIRYKTQLSSRAREIAILELARLHKSEFEWYAHERVGAQAGLSESELSELHSGAPSASLSVVESCVRDLVRRLVQQRDLDDETYRPALDLLGQPTLFELVALVGYYESLALQLNVFRTPVPEGVEPVRF
jgi:4-carboxymuconolactone decarboxylase